MEHLYAMKKMIEDLQRQKVTPNHSVVTMHIKEGPSYLRNENLTKIKIIKTITENQNLPSSLVTQSSSKKKELYSNGLETANNYNIDLTENIKSEASE